MTAAAAAAPAAAAKETIAAETVLSIYRHCVRIRRFEEKVARLFKQGLLPGFVHLYIGEEAVAAGVGAALRGDDHIVSTHRGHGHVIAKGGDLNRMMAELFGKAAGYCKGKGGSMHIADFSIGMLGACGIVGGGIPIALGAALSSATRGTDQVAATFFGDGAANEGSFHESLNLASVLGLPVLFVCENNHYGEFTPAAEAMNITDVADRAAGYGIPGVVVDGADPLAVHLAAADAAERGRRGGGPTLIEAKTHRGDHAEGEKAFLAGQPYRDERELERAAASDPIERLAADIARLGLFGADVLEAIDREAAAAVEEAVEFARASPDPGPEVLMEDRWASG